MKNWWNETQLISAEWLAIWAQHRAMFVRKNIEQQWTSALNGLNDAFWTLPMNLSVTAIEQGLGIIVASFIAWSTGPCRAGSVPRAEQRRFSCSIGGISPIASGEGDHWCPRCWRRSSRLLLLLWRRFSLLDDVVQNARRRLLSLLLRRRRQTWTASALLLLAGACAGAVSVGHSVLFRWMLLLLLLLEMCGSVKELSMSGMLRMGMNPGHFCARRRMNTTSSAKDNNIPAFVTCSGSSHQPRTHMCATVTVYLTLIGLCKLWNAPVLPVPWSPWTILHSVGNDLLHLKKTASLPWLNQN